MGFHPTVSIVYFDHVAEFFEQIDEPREPVGLYFALIAEVMAKKHELQLDGRGEGRDALTGTME